MELDFNLLCRMSENIFHLEDDAVTSNVFRLIPQEQSGQNHHELLIRPRMRELQKGDLSIVSNILTENIIKQDASPQEQIDQAEEVFYYMGKMADSLRGENDRQYTVAELDNTVVGVFGFMSLGKKTGDAIQKSGSLIPVPSTAELVNFYVSKAYQRQKVGGKLWENVHNQIADQGYNSIAFLSTDRHAYMWGYYQKKGYAPVAEGEHFGHPCAYFYKVVHPQLPMVPVTTITK